MISEKWLQSKCNHFLKKKWRHPILNELTPIIFDIELTHLGLEASKCPTYVPDRFHGGLNTQMIALT